MKQFLIDEDALADVKDALGFASAYLESLSREMHPRFTQEKVAYAVRRLQDGKKVKKEEGGEGGGIHEIDEEHLVAMYEKALTENVKLRGALQAFLSPVR